MKLALFLVIALPLVISAPQKKALELNPFLNSILNIFHANELKTLVTDLVQQLGSNEREAECEKECNHLVDTQFNGTVNILTHQVCPICCHSLQELVHYFHIPTTAPGSASA